MRSDRAITHLAEARFRLVPAVDSDEGMADLGNNAPRFRGVLSDIRLGPSPDAWKEGRGVVSAEFPSGDWGLAGIVIPPIDEGGAAVIF